MREPNHVDAGRIVPAGPLLIVEDDQDSCEMLLHIVQRIYPAIATLYAHNGKSAWELFQRHTPAIVITDLNMPEMDGMQLARLIRKERPSTRLIGVSADFERALSNEPEPEEPVFDHLLTKPFYFRELMAVIENGTAVTASS